MKKIIMAAAALTAGIVMAADDSIVSSTVVGYRSNNMNVGGFTMSGNAFVGLNEKTGIRLTDLVPKGYEQNQDIIDAEGTTSEFNIQLLSKLGKTNKTYFWVRTYDIESNAWLDDGHWTLEGKTIVSGDENDALFTAGQGLWIAAPDWAGDEDAVYSFTDSGSVSTNDVKWVFNVGGFTPCSNPFPCGIRLSSLIPMGYEENQDILDAEGTTSEFNIQILTKLGKAEKIYFWVRTYDVENEKWLDDGHWTFEGKAVVANSDNDPLLEAGQGLWIAAPDYADDDGAEYSMTARYPQN